MIYLTHFSVNGLFNEKLTFINEFQFLINLIQLLSTLSVFVQNRLKKKDHRLLGKLCNVVNHGELFVLSVWPDCTITNFIKKNSFSSWSHRETQGKTVGWSLTFPIRDKKIVVCIRNQIIWTTFTCQKKLSKKRDSQLQALYLNVTRNLKIVRLSTHLKTTHLSWIKDQTSSLFDKIILIPFAVTRKYRMDKSHPWWPKVFINTAKREPECQINTNEI